MRLFAKLLWEESVGSNLEAVRTGIEVKLLRERRQSYLGWQHMASGESALGIDYMEIAAVTEGLEKDVDAFEEA